MHTSVVLVTTNDSHAGMVRILLGDISFYHCRSEEEAQAFCRAHKVDAALVLHDLPALDAHALFAALSRQQPDLAGIMLVAEKPDVSVLQEAMLTGFSGVVAVPDAAEILPDMVRQTLQRLRARREHLRLSSLLAQHVRPDVVDRFVLRQENNQGAGVIAEDVALFADIHNFTRLVQHAELAQVCDFLHDFYRIVLESVFARQGALAAFMGDAALAVFGAPFPLENTGLAAVKAAWSIREQFMELREQWRLQSEIFAGIDLGIGVTAGTLFVGNIGHGERINYTVIGNPVNFAQRLAGESVNGAVYVTRAVSAAIVSDFTVTDLGLFQLRGVEGKLSVFSASRVGSGKAG